MQDMKHIEETLLIVTGLISRVVAQMSENVNAPEPAIEMYCDSLLESMNTALNEAVEKLYPEHSIPGTPQHLEAGNLFLLHVCGTCLNKMLQEPQAVALASLTVLANEGPRN